MENKLSDETRDQVDQSVVDNVYNEKWYETVISHRWIMSYTLFWCVIIHTALQVNMSIAILCMTGDNQNIANTSFVNSTELLKDVRWSRQAQGWVLSSLFYGYIITQIPGGYLATRLGGKKVLISGTLMFGLSTILIPPVVRWTDSITSVYIVCTLRVLSGLSAGVVMPSIYNLWGRWLPPLERSKHVALVLSGVMVGTVVMLGTGGFFCEWTSFDGGWPSMFYVVGGTCCLSCVMYWITLYDSPNQHPRIKKSEKCYIVDSLQHSHTDEDRNGLISILSFLMMFLMANTVSRLVDWCRSTNKLSTAATRKISTAVALVGSAIFLVVIGYIPDGNKLLAVFCLVMAVGLTGLTRTGFHANFVDIAPRYAGEMYAISNTLAAIPGLIAPQIINAITKTGSKKEWSIVFYIWSGIFILASIVYSVLGQGELQDWARTDKTETDVLRENNSEKLP